MGFEKKYDNYYLGLDIGTNSVGWAVTNPNYELLRFHQKDMWGARLFDEAETAADRRAHRIARRMIQRRMQRIALLQDVFREEIMKKDPSFFLRLKESMFHEEDKQCDGKYSLFNDKVYNDATFHKAYPTIYHLRSRLIHSAEPHDIRLVYLALHHIIKYRGSFLFNGDFNTGSYFEEIYKEFADTCSDMLEEVDLHLDNSDIGNLKDILSDRQITRTDKQKKLFGLFGCKSTSNTGLIIRLITGGKVKLADVFPVTEREDQISDVELGSSRYDESIPMLEAMLEEYYSILELAKAIYDWSVLDRILQGKEYISDAKVEVYKRYGRDLMLLKKKFREYLPEEFYSFFKDPTVKKNYCHYEGYNKSHGQKVVVDFTEKCTQEDICKEVKKKFEAIANSETGKNDKDLQEIMARVNDGTFLTRLRTRDNSVVPNQLHEKELMAILNNASNYLVFLNKEDDEGLTPIEKIQQILTFRIPYYVGPLVDKNHPTAKDNSWVVRRSRAKIYPWNFEEIVDMEASAERFIQRMTAECTYLKGCSVLPKNSLLYTRFTVLNEINNIQVNGKPISVEIKQGLYTDLFDKFSHISFKDIKSYLNAHGYHITVNEQITGIDNPIKSSLATWHEMRKLLGDSFDTRIAEGIIYCCTILGDDRKMLYQKLKKEFGDILDDSIIQKASNKRYKGWGRLSGELLTGIYDSPNVETGEVMNIITTLWETNDNLMKLLSNSYGFLEAIEKANSKQPHEEDITYKAIEDLYVSPAVKRGIWQCVLILKEIMRITGHAPAKVFIEMARGGGEKGKRTESRKQSILKLYKDAFKKSAGEMVSEHEKDRLQELLDSRTEEELRSKRWYLYFMQLGRCMYTGRPIDPEKIYDSNIYDVDHIYPQSKVKDDSLDNLVLVDRTVNIRKGNDYPLPSDIRDNQALRSRWEFLYTNRLMSKAKYERLIRSTSLTNDELSAFVARQIVFTRQSTKAVADILGRLMPDTEIVYVKANLVSELRRLKNFNDGKWNETPIRPDGKEFALKCRDVNDLHHAKDAYLNIVVGNVYNTKFTKDPRNFYRNEKDPERRNSMNRTYDFHVERNGVVAWVPGLEGSISTVGRMMRKNTPLVTRMVYDRHGKLFDTNPVSKGKWQVPLKSNDSRFQDPAKYGGYNSVKGSYYILVEHVNKNETERSIVAVPVYLTGGKQNAEKLIAWLEQAGFAKPRIVVPHMGVNSVVEIDGYKMHIRYNQDVRIGYIWAHQLIIGYENELYLRNVLKYCDRDAEYCNNIRKKNKGESASESGKAKRGLLEVNQARDGITPEDNLKLYDIFLNKLTNTMYHDRLEGVAKSIADKRDVFVRLTPGQQCLCLKEMLNLFTGCADADLTAIGLSANAGKLRTSQKISGFNSVKLINQSPTGLFEDVVDLLSINFDGQKDADKASAPVQTDFLDML